MKTEINEDLTYLNKLIKDAINEAFGKTSKQNNIFDDDDDEDSYKTDDESNEEEYTEDDDEVNTNNTANKLNQGRGSAYKHNTYSSTVSNAENQLLKKRARENGNQNSYFSQEKIDALFDPNNGVQNKYNKTRKDFLQPDKYGKIKVWSSTIANPKTYDFPIVMIDFLNIEPSDCVKIFEKFHKNGYTEKVTVAKTRENNTKDGVRFIVSEYKYDEWFKNDFEDFIKMIDSFKNEDGSPKYFKDKTDEENLRSYVKNRVMTGKDISQYFETANKNNIELFNSFIEAESDEKVEEFIKLYQRNNIIDKLCADLKLDVSFGRILSVQNASIVLSSGKLTGAGVKPSFILTESMWQKLFKRGVKPNAVPYYIFVPRQHGRINTKKEKQFTSKPYKVKDENGEEVTISKTPDVLNIFFMGKKWDELTPQQQISASIMCDYINPSKCLPVKEYDISDTYLYDENDDPFNEKMGMINRFTGELNKPAMDFIKTQNKVKEDEEDNKDEEGMFMTSKQINEYALSNLMEFCEYNNIKVNNNGDVSKNIINIMKTIAKKYINLSKPENVDILVNDAVYATCKVQRIALDLVNSLKTGKPTDRIEYSQYFKAFSTLFNIVNGEWKNRVVGKQKELEENKNIKSPFKVLSIDELDKIAKTILNEQKIFTDTFFNILEKIQ